MKQYLSDTFSFYVFDLDGTIVNTLKSIHNAGNLTLEALGLQPQSLEAYKGFVGYGVKVQLSRMIQAAMGEMPSDDLLQKAIAIYMEVFATHCTDELTVYPNIEAFLDLLSEKGIPYACLTNKPQPMAESTLKEAFPKHFNRFVSVLGQSEKIPRKPAPDGLLALCELQGIKPENTILIGDSDADIKTAKAAGAKSGAVAWGFQPESYLASLSPEYLLEDTTALFEAFESSTLG